MLQNYTMPAGDIAVKFDMAKSKPLRSANVRGLASLLHEADVRFILIGGGAGIIHGLARFTQDVDVVYSRDDENINRLVKALMPYQPYPRGAPPGLPFRFDAITIRLGMNFSLETTLGYLDLLGEVTGGGSYEDILPHSDITVVFGIPIRCVALDYLIHLKRAAGRAKDFEMVAQLEALLEERNKPSTE